MILMGLVSMLIFFGMPKLVENSAYLQATERRGRNY